MARIRELLSRSLDRPIEEIIKVDQTDEYSVFTEIDEYVVTNRIREQYRQLLTAIADAPQEPTEGIGVWISGFFGSGKSSFAKNLGYALANRSVLGSPAAKLFAAKFDDPKIDALISSINARIPTELFMFDVQVDRAVKKATERIAEIMYTVLLRELGYAEDYDIAELEIELEGERKLGDFEQLCRSVHDLDWQMVRKGAQKISRASAILHQMVPGTYPTADSWAQSIGAKSADITVAKFVDRAFELTARRQPGKALVFIIDEIGQYVARSADKIEDLRAVIERFGQEGKNRLKAKQIPAPAWVIVTSQEKLDEVVAAIDSKRVELAKLQDRFKHHVDLAPADIREVATRRVLSKKDEATPILRTLFADNEGQLNLACRLERTSRSSEIREDAFIQFYPYLPHYIDLSIDIMSGIRLQPGAPRHYGGSNRTIIKQAFEMLVSDRTALAEKPIGSLVTLDLVYELVEGNLSSEKQHDINDIYERFRGDPADGGWALRSAKAICLLEFVRDLPRTPANIAAMLVDTVGMARPEVEVERAIERLRKAQYVRETEEGYKLLTAQEKNWDTERGGYLGPSPKDRNEIKRKAIGDAFAESQVTRYRHSASRTFRVAVSVDGVKVGEDGDIPLDIMAGEDAADFGDKQIRARDESREPSRQNQIFWVMSLNTEIDELIANVHASRQMVAKYDQLRAQNRITNEEAASLASEKSAAVRSESRLSEKMSAALIAGTGYFRGLSRDGSSLGKTVPEVFRKWFELAVPELYPKLSLGVRPLKGT